VEDEREGIPSLMLVYVTNVYICYRLDHKISNQLLHKVLNQLHSYTFKPNSSDVLLLILFETIGSEDTADCLIGLYVHLVVNFKLFLLGCGTRLDLRFLLGDLFGHIH
jgi:hypothetical protein